MFKVLTQMVVIAAAAASSNPGPTSTQGARMEALGETVSMEVGEAVTLDGTTLTLSFTGITDDSRCPQDVDCIWAGEATVVLSRTSNGENGEVTLKAPPAGSASTEAQGYRFTIIELEPQTHSERHIDPGDYVVQVRVDRK